MAKPATFDFRRKFSETKDIALNFSVAHSG